MTTSKSQSANSGRFSTIFRRLLCSDNVSTHPSDQISDSKTNLNEEKYAEKKPKSEADQTQSVIAPGIVARLMGLDSLPQTNWVSNGRTSDSINRSRSLNFVDYLLKFDLTEAQHRRVRTSVSFREVPELFNPQKQNYTIVYLDNVDEEKEIGFKVRKSDMGFGQVKPGKKKQGNRSKHIKKYESLQVKNNKASEALIKNKKVYNLKKEPRREIMKMSAKNCIPNGDKCSDKVHSNYSVNLKVSSPLKPENQKKEPERFNKKKKNKKVQYTRKKVKLVESNSENYSSPLSYLKVNDIMIQSKTKLTEADLKIKVKSPPSEVTENNYIIALADQLRWLSEEYTVGDTNWVAKIGAQSDSFADICVEIEESAIEMLLHEAIDELFETL